MAIYSRFAEWGLPCPITGKPGSIGQEARSASNAPLLTLSLRARKPGAIDDRVRGISNLNYKRRRRPGGSWGQGKERAKQATLYLFASPIKHRAQPPSCYGALVKRKEGNSKEDVPGSNPCGRGGEKDALYQWESLGGS
eukprot:1150117-Pelagomonas_calceolata.AAC.3